MGIGRIFAGSTGMNVNRMMDALGLPDSIGDLIGATIDSARGDMVGYARNMMDLTSGMRTGDMDMMFGHGLPPAHFVPRPFMGMGGMGMMGAGYAGLGAFGAVTPHSAMIGRSMQLALMNPAFAMSMQGMLGGMCIPDGRMDGRVTCLRYNPMFMGMGLTNSLMMANPLIGGVFRGLANMELNMTRMMGGMLMPGFNMPGAEASMVVRDPWTANLANDCGIRPPLSFEDLLFLMMMKYTKRKEKEILGKMNQLTNKDKQGPPMAGGMGAAGLGYGSRFAGAMKGVGTIGGGLLGGLAGGGAFSPISALLGAGAGRFLGSIVGGAGRMLGGGLGLGGGYHGGGMGPQGKGGGYDPMDPNKSDTSEQAAMQKMMNDLKKVYELLSNTVKAMHDMQMASVRNTR